MEINVIFTTCCTFAQCHNPSPPSHLWVGAHGQATAPAPSAGNCGLRGEQENVCHLGAKHFIFLTAQQNTMFQSVPCVFLLCQSLNLLCNGVGEKALSSGCHCGFMSHDRCRSACILIVSCGAWCHKQWFKLCQRGQLKAKVQWSGLMPEEMRRFGLAKLHRKRNIKFAQWYKHNKWPPSFCQRAWRDHCYPSYSSVKKGPCYSVGDMVDCMLYIMFYFSMVQLRLPRFGRRGLEFGWMDVNYYCWPERWCILCAGCVWERTEVLAMKLAYR